MFYHLSINLSIFQSFNLSIFQSFNLSIFQSSRVFQELRHFPFPANMRGFHCPFRDFALPLSRHQLFVLTRSTALLDDDPVLVPGKVRCYEFFSCHNFLYLSYLIVFLKNSRASQLGWFSQQRFATLFNVFESNQNNE